jgi:hypothetical protein
MIGRLRLIIFLIVIFGSFISLVIAESSEKANAEQIKTTNTIRIGTVDVDASKQIMKFQPTADYIAAKISNQTTQYRGEVTIPSTVDDMINLLKEQRIDLYFESPLQLPWWIKKVEQCHSC